MINLSWLVSHELREWLPKVILVKDDAKIPSVCLFVAVPSTSLPGVSVLVTSASQSTSVTVLGTYLGARFRVTGSVS